MTGQPRAMLIVGLLWLSAWPAVQGPAPLPSREEFASRLRRGVQLDHHLQKDFTYIETRRDVKVSRLGKVTVGPVRTFEVYPSDRPGGPYKRLIAVDGRPLGPEELARRDAEHARHLRESASQAERETAEERAERLAEEAEEERRRKAMLEDAFSVFTATIRGRETSGGRSLIVAGLDTRQDAHVQTREGGWMKAFEGRLWVDEASYQVVRLEMEAVRDITIGWGFVGRLNRGSRIRVVRQLFEDAWLPHQTTYEASGRTLLFRPFAFSVTTTYSQYKRR